MNTEAISRMVALALREDIGSGDVTSRAIFAEDALFGGRFVCKAEGVVAGLTVAQQVFAGLDANISFRPQTADGQRVAAGEILATVCGPGPALLSGERVALNFMQRMSGIATRTARFVDAVRHTRATILDTRKTAPGLRAFDKWAVQLAGGKNHRFGLFDMAMIKENHIAAAGGIPQAMARVRAHTADDLPIVVEVQSLTQLGEVLPLSPYRVLLDNMTLEQMREAVSITDGRVPLEASGNVGLNRVAAIAETGVDFISVGELTHSVTALDISFLLDS